MFYDNRNRKLEERERKKTGWGKEMISTTIIIRRRKKRGQRDEEENSNRLIYLTLFEVLRLYSSRFDDDEFKVLIMLTTCRILMRELNLSEYSSTTYTKGRKSSSEDLINIDRRLN